MGARDDPSPRPPSTGRRVLRAFLLLSAAAALVAAVFSTGLFVGRTQASHSFTDVPDGAYYHNAVEWIKNRVVTAGCGSGLYCPDTVVTRGMLAQFIYKLGLALSPTPFGSGMNPGALDLDADPIICLTAGYTPPYPQHAALTSWASLKATGALGYQMTNVVSTNAGVTWTEMDLIFSRGGASAVDEWTFTGQMSGWDMSPGTTYMFAIKLLRDSGTGDASASRCELGVVAFNRNPTSSPLGPAPAPRPADGP